MLSQEFGIAADEKAQDAFKALLANVSTAAIDVWTNRVKNTLWPSAQPLATTSEIDYIAYYALYKANILYQYVSGYVLNSSDVETGLVLGFGWNSWNELYSYQIIDKDETGLVFECTNLDKETHKCKKSHYKGEKHNEKGNEDRGNDVHAL